MTGKLKNFLLSNPGLWIVFIAWSLFISNFWLPRNWGFYGTEDWDLTYSTFEAARKSIVDYGEWPGFNPYLAFGSDMDANPQAVHASIFFLPILLFGTFYGYKVSILMAIIIGCWGCMKLFSLISNDKLICLFSSFIFAGCAYFSRHIFQAGHSNVLYFYLLPWLVYHLQSFRTNGKLKHAFWAISILFMTISGGAPFIFIASVLLIMIWCIALLWAERTGIIIPLKFAAIVLFAFGLALWKIVPVWQAWQASPRLLTDDSGINPLIWLQALADLETDTRTPHQWHEFAMGFSLVLLALIIYSIRNIDQWKKWTLLFLFFFWLGLGNMPSYANPWYVLHHYFPIFNGLRAPYRFGIISVMILAIASVKSTNYIINKRLLYFVLGAISLTQTLSYNSISKKLQGSPRLDEIVLPAPQLMRPMITCKNCKDQFIYLKYDFAIINAYEPLHLSPVRDTMDRFLEGAELISFSPNNLRIRATDSIVKISIRHSNYWQLKGNAEIINSNGLLAFRNASGDILISYKNPNVINGLFMSLIVLILLIVSSLVYSRHSRKTA